MLSLRIGRLFVVQHWPRAIRRNFAKIYRTFRAVLTIRQLEGSDLETRFLRSRIGITVRKALLIGDLRRSISRWLTWILAPECPLQSIDIWQKASLVCLTTMLCSFCRELSKHFRIYLRRIVLLDCTLSEQKWELLSLIALIAMLGRSTSYSMWSV